MAESQIQARASESINACAEDDAAPRGFGIIDDIYTLTTRIRYFTEAIEEASDHVRSPRGAELDAMNKMLVFTAVIRETAAELDRLADVRRLADQGA